MHESQTLWEGHNTNTDLRKIIICIYKSFLPLRISPAMQVQRAQRTAPCISAATHSTRGLHDRCCECLRHALSTAWDLINTHSANPAVDECALNCSFVWGLSKNIVIVWILYFRPSLPIHHPPIAASCMAAFPWTLWCTGHQPYRQVYPVSLLRSVW